MPRLCCGASFICGGLLGASEIFKKNQKIFFIAREGKNIYWDSISTQHTVLNIKKALQKLYNRVYF
jgi:hypothetical protein